MIEYAANVAYTNDKWIKRHHARVDISSVLTHLTRGANGKSAVEVLLKILADKTIKAGHGYIYGNRAAVCFQDAPLVGIAQNLKFEIDMQKELGRAPRYEGVGLAIGKWKAFERGARPVLYEQAKVAKKILPADEYWRIVGLDLTNSDKVYDWTHEREWRVAGDFKFEYGEIALIVASSKMYRELIDKAPAELLKAIGGVTVLVHANA